MKKYLQLEKLDKKLNKVQTKSKGTQISGKKRRKKANYPWLKRESSRSAKAYMCYIVDNSEMDLNFGRSAKKKKDFFAKYVYPAICKKYPDLYSNIEKYYNEKGVEFSKPHYYDLLYARLVNCYDNGFIDKTYEHPTLSLNSKFKKCYFDFFL